MFFKKMINQLKSIHQTIDATLEVQASQWKYIQALLEAEKQNRKDLNTVIAKINQMKPKGEK